MAHLRRPTAPPAPLSQLRKALRGKANKTSAAFAQKFFQTHPGGYGEGDHFLGLSVPTVRATVKAFRHLPLEDLRKLLASRWHEERLAALVLFVDAYERGDEAMRRRVGAAYYADRAHIDQWDLVDVSAPRILGPWAAETGREDRLFQLARARRLWDRRLAIIATFHYLRRGETALTFQLAEKLVHDSHDLMHKAVGWALREAGKKDLERLRGFLGEHAGSMPRTALRYAIERMDRAERTRWLQA